MRQLTAVPPGDAARAVQLEEVPAEAVSPESGIGAPIVTRGVDGRAAGFGADWQPIPTAHSPRAVPNPAISLLRSRYRMVTFLRFSRLINAEWI